jgi:hypothetical protein
MAPAREAAASAVSVTVIRATVYPQVMVWQTATPLEIQVKTVTVTASPGYCFPATEMASLLVVSVVALRATVKPQVWRTATLLETRGKMGTATASEYYLLRPRLPRLVFRIQCLSFWCRRP